jgi:hypothetical protein
MYTCFWCRTKARRSCGIAAWVHSPPPVEARLPPSTGEEPEPGAWIVRAATLILGNERWLHRPAGGGGRGSRSEQADVPGKAANAAASGAPCRAEASGGVVKGQ